MFHLDKPSVETNLDRLDLVRIDHGPFDEAAKFYRFIVVNLELQRYPKNVEVPEQSAREKPGGREPPWRTLIRPD